MKRLNLIEYALVIVIAAVIALTVIGTAKAAPNNGGWGMWVNDRGDVCTGPVDWVVKNKDTDKVLDVHGARFSWDGTTVADERGINWTVRHTNGTTEVRKAPFMLLPGEKAKFSFAGVIQVTEGDPFPGPPYVGVLPPGDEFTVEVDARYGGPGRTKSRTAVCGV